eukprot:jgi/Galph1/3414/GphlegSOOS_G2071.1
MYLSLQQKKSAGRRFVLYDSRYGSLNNQLNSLINGLVIAKRLGATLVLGYAHTPGGSVALVDDNNDTHSYLIGHYFQYDLLNTQQPIMKMDHFIQTYPGNNFPKILPFYIDSAEEYTRNGDYYKKLGFHVSLQYLEKEKPSHVCHKVLNRGQRILETCKNDSSTAQNNNCSIILLGFSFTNLYNCTFYDEWWYHVRKYIQPKPVIQQAALHFLNSVRRPLVVIHIRYVGGSDAQDTSFYETIYDYLQQYESNSSQPIGSVYVAGMKDKRQVIRVDQAVAYLQKKLDDVNFYSCANVSECAENTNRTTVWTNQEDDGVLRGYYGTILLDQWMGVVSDYFLGRAASTFSQNIVYWRILRDDNRFLLY